MNQTRLYFECTNDEAKTLARLVEDRFEDDSYPVAAFETDGARQIWSISVYVPQGEADNDATRLSALLTEAGVTAQIGREELPDTDWVTATLADLKPVRAGRFIVHGGHDRNAPSANDYAIEIEAGQAFGTGHHGTTAGCLDMLGECEKSNSFTNALDLGTGSGVLAVAIAKSTQAYILATDIDPVSVTVARENCRLNGVASRVEVVCAAGFAHRRFAETGPFDLIVANILAGPLQKMARDLARHAAPGATIILSGLLPHQQVRITATCRGHGLVFRRAHLRDGWLTLVLQKD